MPLGRRKNQPWMIYEGGPRHGQREPVAVPLPEAGAILTYYAPPVAGMQTPYLYQFTHERRRITSGASKVNCYIARFVSEMPNVPETRRNILSVTAPRRLPPNDRKR